MSNITKQKNAILAESLEEINRGNVRYDGKSLTINGSIVSFMCKHSNSEQWNPVSFDLNKLQRVRKKEYKAAPIQGNDSVKEWGNVGHKIESIHLTFEKTTGFCERLEINFYNQATKFDFGTKDWNVRFIDETNPVLRTIRLDYTTGKVSAIKQKEKSKPVNRAEVKIIQGMPQNFAQNKANVVTLQQYLVRMGEQQNLATNKVPTGVDGLYGPKTEAAAERVMKNQGWTWDQLWAQAVQYAKQIQGQQSQPQGQANQELAHVNPEAAEFANPQKLTAQTQGIAQQAQPASAAQYAANASNALQPNRVDASAVKKPTVMAESVEKVKKKFYDIFNRMNNATILQ